MIKAYTFSTYLERVPTPGRGAPKHYVITDEHRRMVATMRANGMSVAAIGTVLGVKEETINRLFKEELKVAYDVLRAKMGAALVEAGLAGNVSAMKFWLANRCHEWQQAQEGQNTEQPEGDDENVHFYLPPNHRDEPEQLPPVIDGEAA